MSLTRFRVFSEVWNQGPEAFIEDLRAQGFAVGETRGNLAALWTTLREPRSLELSSPTQSQFTYITKNPTSPLKHGWGLLLIAPKYFNAATIPTDTCSIAVSDTEASMDFILKKITRSEWTGETISPPPSVQCEANVLIGEHSEIGPGTILESGVRIGARVKIGARCRIGANSRIADDCVVGDDCTLTGMVSIGGQGFGLLKYPKIPYATPRLHVGRVIVGNGVRLGALVAIDRGVFEDTTIGDGTCIDNVVHVAHNVSIGKNGILCALSGVAGSTHLGDRVVVGGATAIADHLKIGNDVVIAPQSGINRHVEEGGKVKGSPPKPIHEALKLQLLYGKLPELFRRVEDLEKK
jgi:UDP-3-O-[3-hydroxymyristoyl] glucosamine N-acyltransferase